MGIYFLIEYYQNSILHYSFLCIPLMCLANLRELWRSHPNTQKRSRRHPRNSKSIDSVSIVFRN